MNRRNFLSLGALVPATALLVGCNPETLQDYAQIAVDQLLPQLKANFDPAKLLIVAPLVNVDDLEASSTFGRTFAEMVGARLAQAGVRISDVRIRNPLVYRPTGELVLTREASTIGRTHDAQAVLVGTYSVMRPRVYASLKAIRVSDNLVLAATDAELRYEG